MSRHDDEVRLRHMVDAAKQAVAFAHGRSRVDLDKDLQFSLALTRLVEIVGKAAKKVSAETAAAFPSVPWRAIAGTRDRLHESIDRGIEDVRAGRTTDARQAMDALRARASGQ
jgi:uncharacterized protein with HEPN domain